MSDDGNSSGVVRTGLVAVATGVGSMPGTDSAEAAAVIAGELPDLPHLQELPARGPEAGMIGRTASLLAGLSSDFSLETSPAGWRLSGGRTSAMSQAGDWLASDVDRAAELLCGSPGAFKIQMVGPWTFAAEVETQRGKRLLSDPGLVADLASGLAEAAAGHVEQIRDRMGGRRIVVQIDEPSLPAVLVGALPTASGMGRYPAVDESAALDALRRLAGLDVPVVLHCCGRFPFKLARDAGFAAVSFDLDVERDRVDDIAETAESGLAIIAGAVPVVGGEGASADRAWDDVREVWRRTGLASDALREVSFSPSCGLASLSMPGARHALEVCRELRRRADAVGG